MDDSGGKLHGLRCRSNVSHEGRAVEATEHVVEGRKGQGTTAITIIKSSAKVTDGREVKVQAIANHTETTDYLREDLSLNPLVDKNDLRLIGDRPFAEYLERNIQVGNLHPILQRVALKMKKQTHDAEENVVKGE
jgi:hypothetical protein